MSYDKWAINAVERVLKEIGNAKVKRMKLKTLLRLVDIERRSEDAMISLTESLYESSGITISPPITKVEGEWLSSIEDWVYLQTPEAATAVKGVEIPLPLSVSNDPWFEYIESPDFILRNEREVETKFCIPLLQKLGFNEMDRHDAMRINTKNGSKNSPIFVDFALYNSGDSELSSQVLMVVEAKKEERLNRQVEIRDAIDQAKSYALWTAAKFCLVTDGKELVVYQVGSSYLDGEKVLLKISRAQLKTEFQKLYNLCSKDALTNWYLSLKAMSEDVTDSELKKSA